MINQKDRDELREKLEKEGSSVVRKKYDQGLYGSAKDKDKEVAIWLHEKENTLSKRLWGYILSFPRYFFSPKAIFALLLVIIAAVLSEL